MKRLFSLRLLPPMPLIPLEHKVTVIANKGTLCAHVYEYYICFYIAVSHEWIRDDEKIQEEHIVVCKLILALEKETKFSIFVN